MPAPFLYNAGMVNIHNNQYTIRNIPGSVDKALRQKAKAAGKSLNETLIETLKRGAGMTNQPIVFHDLDFLIGSWQEDSEFDKAIAEQHRIDSEKWE